jgi:hypothetical protein
MIPKSILYFFIFVMIFTAACNPSPSEFLDGMKCSNACWQGIEPGKTTKGEALRAGSPG